MRRNALPFSSQQIVPSFHLNVASTLIYLHLLARASSVSKEKVAKTQTLGKRKRERATLIRRGRKIGKSICKKKERAKDIKYNLRSLCSVTFPHDAILHMVLKESAPVHWKCLSTHGNFALTINIKMQRETKSGREKHRERERERMKGPIRAHHTLPQNNSICS